MLNPYDFILINFEYGEIIKSCNYDYLIIDTNFQIIINDKENQENINKLLLTNQYIINSVLIFNNSEMKIDIKDIKKIQDQLNVYYINIGKYEIPKFIYNGVLKFEVIKIQSIHLLSSLSLDSNTVSGTLSKTTDSTSSYLKLEKTKEISASSKKRIYFSQKANRILNKKREKKRRNKKNKRRKKKIRKFLRLKNQKLKISLLFIYLITFYLLKIKSILSILFNSKIKLSKNRNHLLVPSPTPK